MVVVDDNLTFVSSDACFASHCLTVCAELKFGAVGGAVEGACELVLQATLTFAVDSGHEVHNEGLAFIEFQTIERHERIVAVSICANVRNVLVLSEDIERSFTISGLRRVVDCADQGFAVCLEDIHLTSSCI